ncbi:CooT family nickel-binding protein [Methanothrix soehngenii]|jgi:predicted RNA-binding protein|uniref:CooT family nickel-binding protein n=2 Tax=Methanothrix TaxID=2222 RepID=UPI0023EF9666|nr:CooT family nickel-binding protein [Methanothrix soehngenii]MCK9585710.1 CooT family nickel-binding protein [Methanothrix soehngenii]MDD5256736.1 CooT family nickel-binding protein [Methanothrix soehngenii]
MCEFTVYLLGDNPKDRQMMAKDILVARRKEGKVLLMDAFGSITPVENATIEEVNTLSQEMILKRMN